MSIGAGGGAGSRYLELTDGATAPVSAAGGVRLRDNAGVLEASQNGGAYAPLSPTAAQYDAWRAQVVWYIDPVSGVDTATGLTALTAIKTWSELGHRMNGGPQKDSTIHMLAPLPVGDPMNFTWDMFYDGTVVTVTGVDAVTVVYTGTYTSAPVARTPATNTLNKLIDAGVANWTPYLVSDAAHIIVPVTGPAAGYPTWAVKKSGSDVLVSTYWDVLAWSEAQPVNGDRYEIRVLPAVPQFTITPGGSGSVNFEWLAFGDNANTGVVVPGGTVIVTMSYCQLSYFHGGQGSWVYLSNCAQLSGMSTEGPCSMDSGCMVDAYGGAWGTVSENEVGSDVAYDKGFVSVGFEVSAVNGGFIRVYEACFMDSPTYGLIVGSWGSLRVHQAWGAGNTSTGIYIGGSGKLALQAGDLSTITGTAGAVSLRGAVLTWAAIAAAADYVADTTSAAVITPMS